MVKNASILGNGRFWPISVCSLEWSTILENGPFPTWGPTCIRYSNNGAAGPAPRREVHLGPASPPGQLGAEARSAGRGHVRFITSRQLRQWCSARRTALHCVSASWAQV
eukprot:6214378-Pleurochrysis_carterae.AAC.1